MIDASTNTDTAPIGAPNQPRPNRHELRMAREVLREMLIELMGRPPETGGILLGPIGSEDITQFCFDVGGRCSDATYSPDHSTLSRLLKEVWIPSGIDFKGFAHSHPHGYDRLSPGDLAYITRLLIRNPDMRVFAAPIVLPSEYRWLPFIVSREALGRPILADLVLF